MVTKLATSDILRQSTVPVIFGITGTPIVYCYDRCSVRLVGHIRSEVVLAYVAVFLCTRLTQCRASSMSPRTLTLP